MARFQISFTTGMVIHPSIEIEGSFDEAKKFAEAKLENYPPGTRYHIQTWRMDSGFSGWVPCDDKNFREC